METQEQPLIEILNQIPESCLKVEHETSALGMHILHRNPVFKILGVILMLGGITFPIVAILFSFLEIEHKALLIPFFILVGILDFTFGYLFFTLRSKVDVEPGKILIQYSALGKNRTILYDQSAIGDAYSVQTGKVNNKPIYCVCLVEQSGKKRNILAGIPEKEQANSMAMAIMMIFKST